MIDNLLFYILASIAIIVAGIAKSGFGGGLGVLSVPLMSLVISPPKAAAIMLPLLCTMDLFTIWHYRKTWDGNNLRILIPAALIGIFTGALFFKYLSDAHIRILVGFIALIFVLNFFRRGGKSKKKQANFYRGSFWGSIAGFTSFGVHAVFFFTIVNYTKLIPYAMLGQLNSDNLITSIILSPLAPLGVLLGIKLHVKVNENLFYTTCYIFLSITGIKLLYDGWVMM
jgi:uncharacterized membrane protein YfcA